MDHTNFHMRFRRKATSATKFLRDIIVPKHFLQSFVVGIFAFSVPGCIPATEGPEAVSAAAEKLLTVKGEIGYRERMALPADAVVIVEINDISRADAPAFTLSEQRIETAGKQVPIPFLLTVARDKLPGPIGNTVQVRIQDKQGKLLWITDTIRSIEPDENSATVNMGLIVLVKV